MYNSVYNERSIDRMNTNRFLCDVLQEMRECTKTLNFSYLLGLIEEVQTLANRMEAKLYDIKDFERLHEEIKALQKKKKKLEEKLEEVTVLNILLNVEDLIFNFDPENNQQKEELFKLKLKIFERDVVRNSEAKTKKTALRKAKSPLEVISIYYSFVKK